MTDIDRQSIYDLLARGHRFSWGYGPEEAIARYLELHPAADEAAVREELDAALAAHGETLEDRAPYMPVIISGGKD
jgi:hypothetical protein